jgi:RNA polymerase sigma-70 factor (ECF subfamily)
MQSAPMEAAPAISGSLEYTAPDRAVIRMDQTAVLADFDAVVAEYWPRVYRFALASLRDRTAAETIAQDCFLRAWKARDRFRGESSLNTWLLQIAVNLIRDQLRSRRLQFWKRSSQSVDASTELLIDRRSSPEMSAAAREQLASVWSATSHLPDRQRTVFLLRFVEDMDLLEIAATMGLSEGAVKTHLFRAVRTVRERAGITLANSAKEQKQ